MASTMTKTDLLNKVNEALTALESRNVDDATQVLKSAVGGNGAKKSSRSSKTSQSGNGEQPKEKRAPSDFNKFVKSKMDELKAAGIGKDVRERLSMASQAWNEYKQQNGIVTKPKRAAAPKKSSHAAGESSSSKPPAEDKKPMEQEPYPDESNEDEEEEEGSQQEDEDDK